MGNENNSNLMSESNIPFPVEKVESVMYCDSDVPNLPVPCLELPKLATAYVAFQNLNCVYTPEKGLLSGTIFPELDMPYIKKQC